MSVTNLPNLSSLAYLKISNCTLHFIFEGVGHKARMEKVMLPGAIIAGASEALEYVETSRHIFLDLSYSSLQSFSFLHSMNVLTDLNLSESALTDESIEHIAYIGTNKRYLNLSNTKVSSDGIGTLPEHVPNLETLLLSGTPVDDMAVPYISMMPSLKVINLSRTNVKGLIHQEGDSPHDAPSFSALKNLSHLEKLELEEINIKDAALFPLMNLDKLIYLSLQSVSLTDASLYRVSSASKLIHLGVRDAVLTDGGLDSFIPPPAMEVLDIRGSWLLTKDVLLRFCHKHPRVEVRHELVEALDKRNFHYSSPSRLTMRTSQHKHKQSKLSMSPHRPDDIFLDQRLKYTREESLALQFSSAAFSTSTHHQGNRDSNVT
ncbi:hypothetical protein CDL12_18210 [Handroanthus impetiginosus]|uniref:Uncharacterized protein n=1 Tax=Handroanthus impetiginosus TaxID=429701 RepID=A0A2G9GV88_9LAMI|nr:hypothetical protein CDL12_18210 [Handroanthus impetiginosus]